MYTNVDCKRLLDYYFVASCNARGITQTKRRLKHSSLATALDKHPKHAKFALKPKIIDYYPTRQHPDTPLLPWVARSAMPRGVRARTRPPAPRFFTFTGWNIDGSKIYGACLEVFEIIEIPKQNQNVYIPKTLGFLSHYPYFFAFNVFLRCLWYVIPKKLSRLEDLIIHFFYDIPAPMPRKKIAYDLGKFKVLLACRNEFDVPIMELPIEVPFTQLSKDRMCAILKLLLLERKLTFVCTSVNELTPVCELFCNLLFPLRWQHLFLPLVSTGVGKTLTDYDEPYLIGLPLFVWLKEDIQESLSSNNSYIIFIDRNEIFNNGVKVMPSNIPQLPDSLEQAISDSIQALAKILTLPENSVSRDVTLQAFRSMFAIISKLIYFAYNCDNNNDSKKSKKVSNVSKDDNDSDNNNDNNNNNNSNNINMDSDSDYDEVKKDDSIGNKLNNETFLKEFSKTRIFKSFVKYYKRMNEDDVTFNNIYRYFKENEGLGKHFARRGNPIQWSSGFDPSHYKKDAFLINKAVMESCDKQAAGSRAAIQSRKRKYKMPNEFELTQSTKEFLETFIFHEYKPQSLPNGKMNQKKFIRYLNEVFIKKMRMLKNENYKKQLERIKKLEIRIHKQSSLKNIAAEILMKNEDVIALIKNVIQKSYGDERKNIKRTIEIIKIINTKKKKELSITHIDESILGDNINTPQLMGSVTTIYEPKRSQSLQNNIKKDTITSPKAGSINIEINNNENNNNINKKDSNNYDDDFIDDTATNNNNNNNNNDKTENDDDSKSNSSSNEDSDGENISTDDTDTSTESDWDDMDGAIEEEPRGDDAEVIFLKAKKRFVNLAEFEIDGREKKMWKDIQKSHNKLFSGAIIPNISVSVDVFNDALVDAWRQNHKQKMKKIKKH